MSLLKHPGQYLDKIIPITEKRGAGGALYSMSDNPFDIGYTVAGEVTYSETNHRATFGNSTNITSVARLLTGFGISGHVRAIEFESVVKPAQRQLVGIRPSLTQNTTSTGLDSGANDVAYTSTGLIYSNAVNIASGLTTWTGADKIGVVYNVLAGTVAFYKNGVLIYTVTGISGDYTPVCQGENANTHSMRVSTAWSYALPTGALDWR